MFNEISKDRDFTKLTVVLNNVEYGKTKMILLKY